MPVFPKILRYAWTGGKKLLAGVKFRYVSEVGKEAARKHYDEIAEAAVFNGSVQNRMIEMGLISSSGKILVKEADSPSLKLALDKGMHHANSNTQGFAGESRKLLDDIWKAAKEAGGKSKTESWVIDAEKGVLKKVTSWEPIGRQDNYFPHFLKRDYAEAFVKDGDNIFRSAARETHNWDMFSNTAKYDTANLDALENAVSKWMALPEGHVDALNPKTVKALNLLITRSMAEHPEKEYYHAAQAISALRNRGINQISSPFSLLRRGRKMNLMAEAYEENPVVAIATYARSAAKQIAHQRVWGKENEKWVQMLRRLEVDGTKDEVKVFERLSEYIDGTAEFKYTNEQWRKFAKGFSEIEVMTKIGLGTAFIPNIFQIGISTIPKVGYRTALVAGLKAFTKEGQKTARGTGINGPRYLAMNLMAGMPDDYAATGALGKLMAIHPGMDLFQRINKFNNIYSALAGEIYIKGMYKKALKGSEKALTALKRYGIDTSAPLTRHATEKGMLRFATDMQLQRDVLSDPLWMNDPRFRLMALFKRFGLRQTAMVYDHFIDEAIIKPLQRGQVPDLKPILMLAAHGVAGGYAIQWTKDAIRENVFKAPPYDKGDISMLQDVWFAVAQSGMGGIVGDIVGRTSGFAAHEILEGKFDNLYFSLMPIALSEFTGIPGNKSYPGLPELARDIAVDWTQYGLAEGSYKQAPNILRKLSPLGAYAGSKVRADAKEKEARQKFLKKLYGG